MYLPEETPMNTKMKMSVSRGFIRQKYAVYLSLLFGCLVLAFTLINVQTLLRGPHLDFSIHTDGTQRVIIEGSVRQASHFSINGRAVAPQRGGAYQEELFVSAGHTIMNLRVRDRFGRSLTKTIPIYIPTYASKEENNQKGSS